MSSLLGVLTLALTTQVGPAPPQAALEGVVRDVESREPLAGAEISLVDLDRTVFAGDDGRYSIPSVPAGPQHVAVRRLGYHPRTLHVLVPTAGRLEFNVSLRPRPIRLEGLSAGSTRPVRGLDPGDNAPFPDRGISQAALRDHPTLAQSDPLRALAGGEVVVEPEAPTGVHVRGGAADHTGFVVDGVPVLNPYHAAGLFSAWNADALAGLALDATAPSPALPDALSGAIVGRTRQPGARLRMNSTISNTEARATVDGPAYGGASYLLSWRMGLTGPLAPGDEASYLTGETGDFLGTLRVPALGGSLQLLVYDSENELEPASAVPDAASGTGPQAPNRFEWVSRSLGASWVWSGPLALTVRLGAWKAGADASSLWHADAGRATVGSTRRDLGFHAALQHRSSDAATEVGVRGRSMNTAYRVRAEDSPRSWDAAGSSAVVTAFGHHSRQLTDRVDMWAGLSVSLAAGDMSLSPRTRLRWRPGEDLVLVAAYSRTHQFAQSLRNTESVVGHVFPADLALAAGVGGVPIPKSDQVVLAAELTPRPGLRLGIQAFDRRLHHLLLVAPVEPGPFASSAFVIGAGTARGASLEVAARGARFGLVASYGLQRVRLSTGDAVYAPRHGTTHTLDAGINVFPTTTSAVRLAVAAAVGRPSTAHAGPFEWEACNVLDQGCEFAGSPQLAGSPGADRLPAYVRLDLGGRKHWHAHVLGRDVLVGVFGTLSNALGRYNTLVRVIDPETGEKHGIEMLPRTPLVLGIDTRF